MDLVGLISKGIDRLVDKRPVGVRPEWNQNKQTPGTPFHVPGAPFHAPASPFHAPGSPFHAPGSPFHAPSPHHQGMQSHPPRPPGTPMHPSQSPYNGFPASQLHPSQGGHPQYAPFQNHPPGTPFHPSQSPFHSFQVPPPSPFHTSQAPGQAPYPSYMPPAPFAPCPAFPPLSPASSRGAASPAPSSTPSIPSDDEKDDIVPIPETGLKVKSRLSNLIAAVSGKISKSSVGDEADSLGKSCENICEKFANCNQDKNPGSSSSIVQKWNSAFNTRKVCGPKETTPTSKNTPLASPVENQFEEGFITSNRTVTGTKILVLREGVLHPGSITAVEDETFVVNFRYRTIQKSLVFYKGYIAAYSLNG